MHSSSGEFFTCGGKVNANELHPNRISNSLIKTEIEDSFSPQDDQWFIENLTLFGRCVPGATAALDLKHWTTILEMTLRFVNRCRKRKILPRHKTANRLDFRAARKNVCQFLMYLRSYLRGVRWNVAQIQNVNCLIDKDFDELLIVLENYLSELRNFDDSLFHLVGSSVTVEHLRPQIHMYHLHLEIRWLFVTILHAKESQGNYNQYQEDFGSSIDAALATVIDDLVYVGTKLFERISLDTRDENLKSRTPYSCTCIRELWLLLQIFIDDLAKQKKSKNFWEYVNKSLDLMIGSRTGNQPITESQSHCKSVNRQKRKLESKNPEIFCIWLIYHLAILYGYNVDGIYIGVTSSRIQPNHNQVEKILKVFVEKGGKAGERDEIDAELKGLILLLTPLICEWWLPRVQVVSLLWDCFHRRLDQPFLLRATGPWLLTVGKKGPTDILKQVKDRLMRDHNSDNYKNISSYGMFLRLIDRFLRKSQTTDERKKIWNQLQGRIYSKFTNSKVEKFSEAGIYNFVSLFLTLALTANTSEVCARMLDFLPSPLLENLDDKMRIIVWKGELAVFILFAERRIKFNTISERFLDEVDKLSCRKDETSRSMLASYVDCIEDILTSSENMQLDEHLLIGGWIDRYFLECQKHKIKTLITVLVRVFDKSTILTTPRSEVSTGAEKMLEALWKHVAGRVRMLVLDSQTYGDNYKSLAELAVRFTLGAFKEPSIASRHRHRFTSLFTHFSGSPIIKDVRIIRAYLTIILGHDKAVEELKKQLKNFNTLVVQAWIKCCVIGNDVDNEETRNLTRYVVNTDDIVNIIQSKSRIMAIENSKTQIIDFMNALMERRENLSTEKERSFLGDKCREYFNQMEKWAMIPITEETKSSSLTEWIYRCVGSLILNCAPMLHVKNQPRSPLRELVNKFMLPSPSSENSYLTDIGKKIFCMIISGIGKLDIGGDLTLQTIITNLFYNYLPILINNVSNDGKYCIISENLSRCFGKTNTTIKYQRIIFEKLCQNFIVPKNGETHKICYLVMLLMINLLNSNQSNDSNIFDNVTSVCLPHVINCYMKVRDHHKHKLQTMKLISVLSSNQYYKDNPECREKFNKNLVNTVRKFLATLTVVYFEFVNKVSEIIPEIKSLFIEDIKNSIKEFEKSFPMKIPALRFSLDQFQRGLRSAEL